MEATLECVPVAHCHVCSKEKLVSPLFTSEVFCALFPLNENCDAGSLAQACLNSRKGQNVFWLYMTIFVKQRKHNWELDNWNVIHDISMNGWIHPAFPFCLLPFLLQHLFHITLLHAGPMIHSIAFSVHSNEGQYNHFCPLFNSWKRIQIKTFLSALFQEVVWTQELHYEWEKSENLTLHLFQCYSDEDIQSL